MAHKILRVFLFSFLFYSSTLFAASFHCEGKLTKVESAICEDKVLSELDSELSDLYTQVYEKSSDRSGLKKEQLQWLRIRNNCKEMSCIKEMYQLRVSNLKGELIESKLNSTERNSIRQQQVGSETLAEAGEVSDYFKLKKSYAEGSYCSELHNLIEKSYREKKIIDFSNVSWRSLGDKKVRFYNGRVGHFYGPASYVEVDVNNDGNLDSILRASSYISGNMFHKIHILNGKSIHDLALIDMSDFTAQLLISGKTGKYYWNGSEGSISRFVWLEVLRFKGGLVFSFIEQYPGYTHGMVPNQKILFFSVDLSRTKTQSFEGKDADIVPLCLISAPEGFKTDYEG